jgi:hypothetical protein
MSETQLMASCNFDGALLARFAEGETAPAERRKVLKHLLSGCESCRAAIAQSPAHPRQSAERVLDQRCPRCRR